MKSFFSLQTRQFIVYIIVTIIAIFLFGILYILRDLILLFFIACFISLLLSPFVGRLGKWKIPDVIGILATFVGVMVILGLFILSIAPVFIDLAEDTKKYVQHSVIAFELQAQNNFPFLEKLPLNIGSFIRREIDASGIQSLMTDNNRTQFVMNELVDNIDIVKNFISKSASQFSTVSLSFASGVTSALTTIFLLILLTFFIMLERHTFLKWFFAILPSSLGNYFYSRQKTIVNAIHGWLRGQMLLAVCMFSVNFIGLIIAQQLGLPVSNIFSLALIAGAMEFVPYIGPVIAFVPAFLMVLVSSPEVSIWALVGVISLYILFQQLEGNIMVPLVMSHTLKLSSLYILLVTLVGAALGGILGVLLSIPLASVLHIFYHDWMHYRKTLKE